MFIFALFGDQFLPRGAALNMWERTEPQGWWALVQAVQRFWNFGRYYKLTWTRSWATWSNFEADHVLRGGLDLQHQHDLLQSKLLMIISTEGLKYKTRSDIRLDHIYHFWEYQEFSIYLLHKIILWCLTAFSVVDKNTSLCLKVPWWR